MKSARLVVLLLFIHCSVFETLAQHSNVPELASYVKEMELVKGYYNFYWNASEDKIYLKVDYLNEEFLYVNSLAAGIGSNDIGLDRGQLGNERVVKFERHGNKVLLVQPNYAFRAVSNNQNEVKSVREAFAQSVLYGFELAAQSGSSLLIDITDFLLRDSHGVRERLSDTGQGSYKLDNTRSALYRENTVNFPKNTEFESIITFTGQAEGRYIRSVTPSPDVVTVRMHHSFIELPDENYEPRKFDPRSGFFYMSYQDYATPIDQPLVKRFIARHRLNKKNPEAEMSEAVEPIIYYLDPGAPDPVRSALLDGARWWNEAFKAAGFIDAFQVKMLPEDAHPLDIRYNVIQWVHRSTRGWSYGASVMDPRTGEIIKGHVSLGSLRVRQDFLIAMAMLNRYDEGTEEMKEMALARIRQLSAHEVGHTLGLVHNYAASHTNRASVMDYPHPLVELDENGKITLDKAYDTQIGAWDKVAINYGYSLRDEEPKKILERAFDEGLMFISDRDARAADGAHPTAHLWDNGTEAATELNRILKVRKVALENLSDNALPEGEPYSSLEEILVPVYLFHRYQLEAAVKVIGGLNYNYAVKGGNQMVAEFIPAEDQMVALESMIACVDVDNLKISEDLLDNIPPKSFGYNRTRESFASNTGPVFDYYSAVETAVQLPLQFLLMPERANRLVMFQDRNSSQPGLEPVLDRLINGTWTSPSSDPTERGIERIVEWNVLKYLMKLSTHKSSSIEVRAMTRKAIIELKEYAHSQKASDEDRAHYDFTVETIERWLDDPSEIELPTPVKAPDGSPIGCFDDYH